MTRFTQSGDGELQFHTGDLGLLSPLADGAVGQPLCSILRVEAAGQIGF